MLTGKRLFQGEDLTDTIAAVVRDKPDLSAAPLEVRRVLERCLEKDPKKRLRDISGVQLLLESGAPVSAAPPVVRSARGPWAVAAAALAELFGGDLDRHLAPDARVAGTVHLAHATLADGFDNLVRPAFLTGNQRHEWPG